MTADFHAGAEPCPNFSVYRLRVFIFISLFLFNFTFLCFLFYFCFYLSLQSVFIVFDLIQGTAADAGVIIVGNSKKWKFP